MAGNSSPTLACGQILFCLRMSKLNYVVMETPFSAFINIRKKFIKQVDTGHDTIENDDKQGSFYESLNREIALLKNKNKKLKYDYEEIELKCESLGNVNQTLEDQIEVVYSRKN